MEKGNKKESFMRNVVAIMVAQIIIKILGMVYKLYLTNREGFGDEGNAIYNAGFQIYALLLALSSIGVPNAIAKLISERLALNDNRGAHKIFKIAFIFFGLIGLAGTLMLFLGAKYISNVLIQIPEAEYTLMALSPSIFFVTTSSVIRGYFNGRENIKATANSQTLEQTFKTLLTIILVEIIVMLSGTATIYMAAGANFATTLATFLCFCYLCLYYCKNRKTIWKEIVSSKYSSKNISIRNIIKKIIGVSIPISLSSLMVAINKNVDSLTVVRGLKRFMTDSVAKMQYGILSGKVDILVSFPLSFNIAFATTLVPVLSALKAKQDIKNINRRISFSLLITILIGLPFTFGIIIFSEQILNLLFPNAVAGGLTLQISAISIIFTVLLQTTNGALQGLGKVMVPAIALGCGAIIKLLINVILIPIETVGINGAAIGTVVCSITSFLISFMVLKKNIKLKLKLSKYIIKPILASIIMGICSYSFYIILNGIIFEKMRIILTISFAIMVYIVTLLCLQILEEEEIIMLPNGKKLFNFLKLKKIY